MTTPAGGIEPDTEADEATTFMGLAPEVRRRMWQVAMTPEPRDPGYIDEPGYAFFNDALKRCEGLASTATASPHPTDGESIGTTAYGYPTERSALQPEAPCEDPFDSRDFYELMYAYRMTPRHMGSEVVAAFEAVKDFARAVNKGRT